MSLPPITNVPPEVLANIFHYTFPGPIDLYEGDISYRLGILQVCQGWRTVALGETFLWNDVRISHWENNPSILERTRMYLRLSKESPISIRLVGFGDSISRFLIPYLERITCLDVDARFSELRSLFLMPADSFPSLQQLRIRVDKGATDYVPEDIHVFRGARNMRYLHIIRPPHPLIDLGIPLSQIHDLNLESGVDFSMQRLVCDLRPCVNVRSCTLTLDFCPGPTAGFAEMPHLKTLELGPTEWGTQTQTIIPIFAPDLEELKICSRHWSVGVVTALIMRSGCALLRLSLGRVPKSFIGGFVEQLQVPSLQVLEMRHITVSNMQAMSTAQVFPALRLLKCRLHNFRMLCELANMLVSRVLSRGTSPPRRRLDVECTVVLYFHTFTKPPAMEWLAENGVHLHIQVNRIDQPDPVQAIHFGHDFAPLL